VLKLAHEDIQKLVALDAKQLQRQAPLLRYLTLFVSHVCYSSRALSVRQHLSASDIHRDLISLLNSDLSCLSKLEAFKDSVFRGESIPEVDAETFQLLLKSANDSALTPSSVYNLGSWQQFSFTARSHLTLSRTWLCFESLISEDGIAALGNVGPAS
jgi:hypothetical protein